VTDFFKDAILDIFGDYIINGISTDLLVRSISSCRRHSDKDSQSVKHSNNGSNIGRESRAGEIQKRNTCRKGGSRRKQPSGETPEGAHGSRRWDLRRRIPGKVPGRPSCRGHYEEINSTQNEGNQIALPRASAKCIGHTFLQRLFF